MPQSPAEHPDDEPVADDTVRRAAALDDYLGGFFDSAGRSALADDLGGIAENGMAELVDTILLLRQAAAADGVVPAATPADAPTALGRHAILRLAGEGGFAIVWEGFDTLLRRPVAVKVLRPELLLSEEARRRFVREAEIAARLVHPHIVTIFEVGSDEDREFIAAEYCSGGSLARWLEHHPGPLPPRTAARLVRALAGAVAHAHDAGVVHRDIKTANVLVAPAPAGTEPMLPAEGRAGGAGLTVKLGDFGLGKVREELAEEDPLSQLTRTGTSIGTPAWMAPEQIDRAFGTVGPATDIHALGLLLDRLLTGRALRGGRTDAETFRQVLLEEPPPADRVVRAVPRDLAAVAAKCLAKRPSDRYASAVTLAADLDRWLNGQTTLARPLSAAGRAARWVRRRPVVAALAAAALAATVVAGVVGVDRQRTAREAVRQAQELRLQRAVADLRRGFEVLRTGNVGGALAHLEAARSVDPDLADSLAGRWLVRRTHGERDVLIAAPAGTAEPGGPPRDLYSIALTPDGTTAAVAGADGRVWLLRDLGGSPDVDEVVAHDEVNHVAFSPDGALLATVGEDGRLRLWRLTDGGLAAADAADPVAGPLYAAAFAPDGRSIAIGGADRTVRIVALDSPADPVARYEFPQRPDKAPDIESLAFVDDSTLAAACGDQVVLLDATTGRVVREFERPKPSDRHAVLGSLVVAADGRRLAACGTSARAHVWDVTTGRIVATSPTHPAWVQGCCFLADGNRLATACRDGVVRVFEVETGALVARLVGHVGRVWAVAVEPAGTLLTCGADGTVRRWDPDEDFETAALRSLPGGNDEICHVDEGPRDPVGGRRSVIAVDGAGVLWHINVTDGSRRSLVAATAAREIHVEADGSRRRVAVSSVDGEPVAVIDVIAPFGLTPLPSLKHNDPREAIPCWTSEGGLVVCSRSGSLCMVSAALDQALPIDSPLRDPVHQVAAAPAGPPRIAAAGNPSAIVPLPPGSAALRAAPLIIDAGEELASVAWSPDASLLACGTRSGRVLLLDGTTGAVRVALVPHERSTRAVAFSRDGRALVSADDACVRISDVSTLTTLDEIRPGWTIKTLRLAADDACLVLGGHAPDDDSGSGRLAVLDLDQP